MHDNVVTLPADNTVLCAEIALEVRLLTWGYIIA